MKRLACALVIGLYFCVSHASVQLQPPVQAVDDASTGILSPDWSTRYSSFLKLARANDDVAKRLSLRMLSDRSLLIRLQAIRFLQKFSHLENVRNSLWEAFRSPLNVHRGRPLMAKIKILEILAQSPRAVEKNQFTEFKNDKKMGTLAQAALAQLDGATFPSSGSPAPLKSLVR